MSDLINYYEKLGVEQTALLQDIQNVLREKHREVQQLQSDGKGDEAAQLNEMIRAAAVYFKNQDARANYDVELKAQQGQKPPTPTPNPSSDSGTATPAPSKSGPVTPVDDLYEKLGIEPSASLADIKKNIEEKRLLSRKLKGVTAKREEATMLQEIVTEGLNYFKDEATRAAYDAKLKAYRDSKVEGQLMADADYYDMIKLAPVATEDMIVKRLAALEAQPEWAEKIGIIRGILLDPAKKQDYDKQLAAKKAYDRQKLTLPPVPLLLGGTEVTRLDELEAVIDANPSQGLASLIDGEIAGWVEWSLGRRPTALSIQQIARQTQQSDTPFIELDQFLRMFNRDRPLVLYQKGQRPGQGDAPVIKQPQDLLAIADQKHSLMVERLDDIQSWMSQAGHGTLLDQLETVGAEGSPSVQIERLQFLLNPELAAPAYSIQGVENDTIDFGAVGKLNSPTRQATIQQSGRGYLYGRIVARDEWITVDVGDFEGATTAITIGIDKSKLTAGQSYSGKIGVRAVDGRAENAVITVNVYMQTIGDMAKNVGENVKELGSKLSGFFKRKSN